MGRLNYIKDRIEDRARRLSDEKFKKLVELYLNGRSYEANDWSLYRFEALASLGETLDLLKERFWKANTDYFTEQAEKEFYDKVMKKEEK